MVKAPILPTDTRRGWKGLARDKDSTSLLQKSLNYDLNKFYDTGDTISR